MTGLLHIQNNKSVKKNNKINNGTVFICIEITCCFVTIVSFMSVYLLDNTRLVHLSTDEVKSITRLICLPLRVLVNESNLLFPAKMFFV